jgi:serine/threonine protein phosphatase PrpC
VRAWHSCHGSITGPRESNDDAFLVLSWKAWRCYHLLVLCDGIGGLPGSGACSQQVIAISEEIARTFLEQRESARPFADDECQIFMNHLTQGLGTLSGSSNHGTTFALALFSYRSALVAWAGDSRIYALMADGTLQQLTEDHHNTKGHITKFVTGNGMVMAGLEVRQFPMDNVVAIIGTSDGIHEACSTEELRQFTVYCMAKRLVDSKVVGMELRRFLQESISDNATFGLVYKVVNKHQLNSMVEKERMRQ